jgi:hypothetical protein
MSLLKFIAVGAAIGLGVNYLMKRDEQGRSLVDDFIDKAPDWLDKAKTFATEKVDQVVQQAQTKAGA